jgi:hypothetical protein
MSRKHLDTTQIENELRESSVFFNSAARSQQPPLSEDKAKTSRPPREVKRAPKNRDTMLPRHHGTTVSRYHDTLIEAIRKAVKDFGKEAATHRFTQEEKQGIADLIYAYSKQGLKTSENEIARIGINFIIQDYKENGEDCLLGRALKALSA